MSKAPSVVVAASHCSAFNFSKKLSPNGGIKRWPEFYMRLNMFIAPMGGIGGENEGSYEEKS